MITDRNGATTAMQPHRRFVDEDDGNDGGVGEGHEVLFDHGVDGDDHHDDDDDEEEVECNSRGR